MASDNRTYFIVQDKHGENYLCPLDRVGDRHAVTDREFDECVEKDYARGQTTGEHDSGQK